MPTTGSRAWLQAPVGINDVFYGALRSRGSCALAYRDTDGRCVVSIDSGMSTQDLISLRPPHVICLRMHIVRLRNYVGRREFLAKREAATGGIRTQSTL